MLFSSMVFLFTFLPMILLLYHIVPKPAKNTVLLLGSLVFYAWGEPVYIFLMMFSIVFNYISGLDIARNLHDKGAARRSLIFNLVVNLSVLGFFKYEGFLLDSINTVLPFGIPYRELALPIGISFYTFQILSYTIDVYRGKVRVQTNLLDFALYVSLFPQLIAGPIVRYSDIQSQLREREESWDQFGKGAQFFICGLSKKVLLANTTGLIFTAVTALTPGETSALTAWIGCIAYTLQIYFDFSGYSDMAIGLGKMFGFRFLKNFDYPYIARSITEFWHRWHISLSSWFREYLYIPLGGNRVSAQRHIFNILIVWFLTGLWHGASWNFVVWGVYYGIVLLIEKYLLGGVLERLPNIVRHLYTLLLVMIGWVFFFSPDLGAAAEYLKLMFGGGSGIVDRESLYLLTSNGLLLIAAIVGATPAVQMLYGKFIYGGGKQRTAVNVAVYGVMFLLCIAYLVTETYNPFLYFRF